MMSNIKSKFITFLSNISIRKKYFFSLFLIIILSFLVFTIVSSVFLTSRVRLQVNTTLENSMTQSCLLLNNITSTINNSANMYILEHNDRDYFDTDISAYMESPGLYSLHLSEFTSDTLYINNISRVVSTDLCVWGNIGSLYSGDLFHDLNDYPQTSWYKSLFEYNHSSVWIPGGLEKDNQEVPCVTLLRRIFHLNDVQKSIGAIAISFPLSEIDTIVSSGNITPHTTAILTDYDGNIISRSDGGSFDGENFNKLLSIANASGKRELFTIDLPAGKYLVSSDSISNSQWKFIIAIPMSDINSQIYEILMSMLITLIVTLPFIVFISHLLTNLITKPLLRLTETMRRVETGDFNVPVLPYSQDEIGELNRSYNVMLTKLILLMDEQIRLEKTIEDTKLRALQAQINPHFLYNTLDMINVMAINGKTMDIQKAIRSLSLYYRLTLNSGMDTTNLKNEIEHIVQYVNLQNMRFNNPIQLHIDIDDELMQCQIFKLCLQPFVENSISHGIMEKESESGNIWINAFLDNDKLFIIIRDDGIGMDEDTLGHLFTPPTDNSGGYGVYNVNERIKIKYGAECGLSITSAIGEGTTVEIRIKTLADNNNNRLFAN